VGAARRHPRDCPASRCLRLPGALGRDAHRHCPTDSEPLRRNSSLFDALEPAPGYAWRTKLASILDSVPYTLLSVIVTLGVRGVVWCGVVW
jgi:hypothetical protein